MSCELIKTFEEEGMVAFWTRLVALSEGSYSPPNNLIISCELIKTFEEEGMVAFWIRLVAYSEGSY